MEISVGPAAAARELDHGVVAEGTVRPETDRPDLQAVGDRVEEAAVMDGEAKDAPLGGREISGRRVAAVEPRAGDVDRLLRGPGNARQLLRGASGDAVIVGTEIGAVHAHAMDEARLAIGDKQRLRLRIEGEPAESSPEFRLLPVVTSANRLTRALAPSIFQIEPGPPRGPQRPGMKAAFGVPVLTWRTRPLGPGATIGNP